MNDFLIFIFFLEHNKPIVEIGLASAGDILPEGWEIVHRSITGVYSGDLNRRTPSPELYIVYKRKSNDEEIPITSLCIIFTERGESIPSSFSKISRTLTNQDGSLTPTGKNASYLCYSRSGN